MLAACAWLSCCVCAGQAERVTEPAEAKAQASTSSREDWSSLALARGTLHASEPILGERDEYPEFTRELLRVQWRDGDPINLLVLRPKGVAKPPVVLYLYGFPSQTDRFLDYEFGKMLTARGFAAVGFVSALTGHRYHGRPLRQWFVSELQESLVTTVHDVQMIIDYLGQRGDLDTAHLGMFGQGSGATIAILAASADSRIRALDLLNPWGDWPEWFAQSKLLPEEERKDFLSPEFLKRLAPLDPIEHLPQLKNLPIRLLKVAAAVTSAAVLERIASAAPPGATIVSYADAKSFSQVSAGSEFFDWIKQQVQAAPLLRPNTSNGGQAFVESHVHPN